jgi:hypothetical protein
MARKGHFRRGAKIVKTNYTKMLDFPRRIWYAHTMSMNIYSKGRFLPPPCLLAGETVFDLDGFVRKVHFVGLDRWVSDDGFTHQGGAFEAIDNTDHPVVRCQVIDALKEMGAL